jgi:hypothetical protein
MHVSSSSYDIHVSSSSYDMHMYRNKVAVIESLVLLRGRGGGDGGGGRMH